MISEATLKCPRCGFEKKETMPAVSYETSYVCRSCGKMLSPNVGDCCVFCSFSDVICPPQQEKRNCCSG